MLIAADLTLLLLDDEKGTWLLDSSHRGPALAGAVLTELVLAHRVQPEPSGAPEEKKARLVVADASPTGDAVLDEALRRTGELAPARAEFLLRHLIQGLGDELVTRLAAAGALERREERIWKVFPRTTLPAVDPTAERSVRDRVASALRGGRAEDERTAALVAPLSVSGTLAKVVDLARLGMSKRDLETASKAVASDDRIAGSVKRAMDAVDTAVVVAVMMPTVVAVTSS